MMSSFSWRVPLSDIDYDEAEEAAVVRVLRSRWLTLGPEVERFEQAFATMVGVPHAIAVTNATSALHLALLAVGVKPGDEVIQPALNFVAAANMTKLVGAEPIFADIIDVTEPAIDPADVGRRITPRTKAVIAMHYAGFPCRMSELTKICRSRGVALIEDACHAVGGRYICPQGNSPHGQAVGDLGDVGAFSFFGNKNIVTGEGGMLTTRSDEIAAFMRSRRSHGMTTLTLDRHRGRAFAYDVVDFGFNYRPTEFVGALGSAQLEKLSRLNERRRAVAALYRERLAEMEPSICLPFSSYSDFRHVTCHIFPIVLLPEISRSKVMQTMKERGVETSIHYRSVHTFSAFANPESPKQLPVSEEFSRHTITLPLYPKMTAADVDYVCEALAEAAKPG
jgi:dTDP-4-amino-4,6-dideoxygalactose transaminase